MFIVDKVSNVVPRYLIIYLNLIPWFKIHLGGSMYLKIVSQITENRLDYESTIKYDKYTCISQKGKKKQYLNKNIIF